MAVLQHVFFALCLCSDAFAAASGIHESELQRRLQEALDAYIAEIEAEYTHYRANLSAQIGWRSSSDFFTVAAGTAYNAGSIVAHRVTANDTFLFGSGTKTFTAAAVMRLIEQGKVGANDPVHSYIDPFLQANNGTTLAGIFGEEVNNATAMDLIRMTSGIPDFEKGDFDSAILKEGDQVHSVYENIHFAANYQRVHSNTSGLLCSPKNCSAYSSTSFEVAGLLLAAVETPEGFYTDMDLGNYAFSNRNRYPSLTFPPVTHSKHGKSDLASAKLSDALTVPGDTYGVDGNGIVADQNPTVLGWTCGHMVGVAGDVATFFYDLFDPLSAYRVLNNASVAEMSRREPLTQGWLAGMRYGAGVFEETFKKNRSHHVHEGEWGWSLGHAGITYGFTSWNFYIPAGRAGFSVVTNVGSSDFGEMISCLVHQIAAEVLEGADAYLNCSVSTRGNPQDRAASRSFFV